MRVAVTAKMIGGCGTSKMVDASGYAGLFLVSLLAATIFPAQSETVLVALLLLGRHSPWIFLMVASAGNILGGVINWILGRSAG